MAGRSRGPGSGDGVHLPQLSGMADGGLRLQPNGASPPGAAPEAGIAQPPRSIIYLKVLFTLLKHKRLIAVTAVAGIILAVLATLMMTPQYRAYATLQIDLDTPHVIKVDGLQPTESALDRTFLQTQYDLLSSRSLADHVAANLGLMEDERFLPETAIGLLSWVRGPSSARAADGAAQAQRKSAILAMLKANLRVEPARLSRLVRISYDHRDPAMAARVANSFAQTFIDDNLARKYAASSYARTFLQEKLQQLKGQLEENEKELRTYAEENNIITLDDTSTLTSTTLILMNESLARARDDRIRMEALWKEAEASQGFGLSQVQASPAIQQTRIRRDELAAQYRDKLTVFKPNFPDMVQLKARIDEFDRLLAQQVRSVKDAIRSDYGAAMAREAALEQEIASLQASLADQEHRSIRYNILKREVESSKTLYEGLLQRYKEIGVAGGVGINNIALIDPAIEPERARSPRPALNLALGLGAGVLAGIALVLARAALDNRFKGAEDVEQTLGIPVLGVIHALDDGTVMDPLDEPQSAVAEAYRSLRTAIQFSTPAGVPTSLYVTSTKPREGKTTTAVALAFNFAQLGLRVLLVDCSVRKPAIHKALDLANAAGLSDILAGNKTLTQVLQATRNPLVHVVTSGPIPANPAELLASTRMLEFVAETGHVFDLVILDGGPLLGLADSVVMSNVAAATLLVVAADDARKEEAAVALRRLRMARGAVIGAVLTKFEAGQHSYGFGTAYGSYDTHGTVDAAVLPRRAGAAAPAQGLLARNPLAPVRLRDFRETPTRSGRKRPAGPA